jgi:hypothetical protein
MTPYKTVGAYSVTLLQTNDGPALLMRLTTSPDFLCMPLDEAIFALRMNAAALIVCGDDVALCKAMGVVPAAVGVGE